jgi:hypothetical protein
LPSGMARPAAVTAAKPPILNMSRRDSCMMVPLGR